jgi:murein DD-endopeptidase MepM/ murein hydrolase activator NlpD
MTDSSHSPHFQMDTSARPSAQTSRRRVLAILVGALAGLAALGQAAAALTDGISGAAVGLSGGELVQAERIPPPTTTVPPPPTGQIAFPIDAQSNCSISDNFGDPRGGSRTHEGLDIMGSQGADLYAVVTGRLTKKYVATPGKTYGAGNGWTLYDEENDVVYKYFHMGSHTEGLEVGDIVSYGDVIGTVGNTGTSGANSDSNYHLHFEYRPGNVAQNPRPLLVRHPNCTFF